MKELVFLLEEPSARVMIEGILPKISEPGTAVRYIVFVISRAGVPMPELGNIGEVTYYVI